MSWLKTMRQFFTLIMGVALFLMINHSCLNLLGRSQVHQRLDHKVLENINNYIYLTKNDEKIVFESKIDNRPLSPEIASMTYFTFSSLDQMEALSSIIHKSECLFLDFQIEDQTPDELDKIIEILKNKTCVFFFTPFLKMKSYFAFKQPRWFFNIMEVDLQKSRFLSSLALDSLAPLKGDFILIDNTKSRVSERLLKEIERRQIVIFQNN